MSEPWLRVPDVELATASTGDVGEHAVEHALVGLVDVETFVDELAKEAPRLGHAIAEQMVARLPQVRTEIPHRQQPGPGDGSGGAAVDESYQWNGRNPPSTSKRYSSMKRQRSLGIVTLGPSGAVRTLSAASGSSASTVG